MLLTKTTSAAVLAALALSACGSMAPPYQRPAAPVPASYRALGAQVQAPEETRAAPQIPWQEYFYDPRLRELVALALEHNRDLRVAALNIERAQAQYGIARAEQFPTAAAGVNASRSPNPPGAPSRYSNSFTAGLQVNAWELDFFGRIASLKDAALAQYLASEEAHRAAQTSLVAAVASAWYALLADEQLLKISRDTLETREETVALMYLRLQNGTASDWDYQLTVSLWESARATLAAQGRQRKLDENALVLLLGQGLPESITASLDGHSLHETPDMPALPAGLPSDLLAQRPDIRQAEQQLVAANANIGAARAAFFPRIALTGQVGSASGQLSNLFHSGTWGYTLAPSALLPIFDAGRNRANLQIAQVQRDILLAQYEQAIQSAFREVSDALDSQGSLREQIDAQRAQLQAERERLRLSDLRYQSGVASYLDLLDAQRSLFALEQSTVGVRLAQLLNQIQLYKALGGGWMAAEAGSAVAAAEASSSAD